MSSNSRPLTTSLDRERIAPMKINCSIPLRGWKHYITQEEIISLYGEIVELIPEDDNPHDPAAVAVEYQGRKIGYLSSSSAPLYRVLLTLGATPKATLTTKHIELVFQKEK